MNVAGGNAALHSPIGDWAVSPQSESHRTRYAGTNQMMPWYGAIAAPEPPAYG